LDRREERWDLLGLGGMQSGGSWERLEDFLATFARAAVSITRGNMVVQVFEIEVVLVLVVVVVVAWCRWLLV
jgi:hypothetical protein